MTKFRAPVAFLAFAAAFALSASAARADVFKTVRLTDVLITGATDGPQSELPAPPPKFAGTPGAPQSGPSAGRPPMVTFSWGSKMPVFKSPKQPGGAIGIRKSR